MKKILLSLLVLLLSIHVSAQTPKWAKKMRQAQVTIVATDAQGTLHESQGIIISPQGDVITEYDAFKGAVSAVAIDAQGHEFPVRYICGASSMYNATKVFIQLGEKDEPFPATIAATTPNTGEVLYIMPLAKAGKKAPCQVDTITDISTFREKYSYLTLAHVPSERMAGCPVMNAQGELVGLLQMPAGEGNNSFVLDAHFLADLTIEAMDAGNMDLTSILIPKRLPEDEAAATSFLYLLGARDTTGYLSYINDFITRFPQSTNGYIMKAEELVRRGDYAAAEATYNTGLTQEGMLVDELHYSFSKALYTVCQDANSKAPAEWTLERAAQEAQLAQEANPLPVYAQHRGQCLFALKKYDQACEQFLSLANTNMRSPEIFLYAAQCKQRMQTGDEEVLALQDSAVACYPTPLPQAAASAVLLRAATKARLGKAREAVMDYNEYEHLMGGAALGAGFYYEREQQEVQCRMYPSAMNDIERAIKLQPREPLFYAECAALNYRVGQTDEAIQAAKKATEIDPKFPDPFRILGVCYTDKGDKAQARIYLQKAIDLGDEMARGVLEKLK